jgi:AraC-like DNA-binding protein
MAAGQLLLHTTDGVPAAQRLTYWREGVMRRMVPVAVGDATRAFHGRMRRIVGDDLELIEYASGDVVAVRSAARCRVDGCDDVTIDMMRRCTRASMEHGATHRIKSGDVYLVDYAKPSEVIRGSHCTVGVTMSRRVAREVLGADIDPRAGMKFAPSGLARVLCQHLQVTFDEADRMSIPDRAVAAKVAKDLALALLHVSHETVRDPDRFAYGFYHGALGLIDRECGDPSLTPGRVALAVGCSRAALYRAFAEHDETVSAAIWQARLERARRMLTSAEGVCLLISEVAARSGFRDTPSFSRMFRQRYGMTPIDAREAGLASSV